MIKVLALFSLLMMVLGGMDFDTSGDIDTTDFTTTDTQ